MVAKTKTPKTLNTLILLIAKNNGITISDITKNKKLNYKNLEFLKKKGFLDFNSSGESSTNDLGMIKFKGDILTFQAIVQILDAKELKKLMKTGYYRKNLDFYCEDLIRSFGEIDSASRLDLDYLEYALGNSPSAVHFFLLDNNRESLREFYQKRILSAIESAGDKVRKEMLEKYNMYFIWENVIFDKIQEDLNNKDLLKENNYYNGYLPVTKKKLEKLLEYRNSTIKKKEKSFFDDVLGLLGLKDIKSKDWLQHDVWQWLDYFVLRINPETEFVVQLDTKIPVYCRDCRIKMEPVKIDIKRGNIMMNVNAYKCPKCVKSYQILKLPPG